eukprot:scaffold3068_cov401-Prasinococcus_capsulatus_cf.AAC.28
MARSMMDATAAANAYASHAGYAMQRPRSKPPTLYIGLKGWTGRGRLPVTRKCTWRKRSP